MDRRSNHERAARVIYLCTTHRQTVIYNSTNHALELNLFRFEQTLNDETIFEVFNSLQYSAIVLMKSPKSLTVSQSVHVFVTSFKRQDDVSTSIAITDVTFDHFSLANDVKAARAFRTVALLFHITRFFNIGSIGGVCSNFIFVAFVELNLVTLKCFCFI